MVDEMSGRPRFDSERDAEWRKRLSRLAYRVTREGATERPYSGELYTCLLYTSPSPRDS